MCSPIFAGGINDSNRLEYGLGLTEQPLDM